MRTPPSSPIPSVRTHDGSAASAWIDEQRAAGVSQGEIDATYGNHVMRAAYPEITGSSDPDSRAAIARADEG